MELNMPSARFIQEEIEPGDKFVVHGASSTPFYYQARKDGMFDMSPIPDMSMSNTIRSGEFQSQIDMENAELERF